jgi:hypothetical protein
MAHFTAASDGEPTVILGDGFLDRDHPAYSLAMDGVSCTVCHQIRDTNLGLQESYNGGFVIDRDLRQGERVLFGPYSVDEDLADEMQAASGFIPAQGLHLVSSELCATCHTLYLEQPGADGAAEPFPLQVTYFEWFYSDYRRTRTCQDCHMPEAEGGVRIATTGANPRSPYAQHTFEGANAYLLRILRHFAEALGVTASDPQLEASIARTRQHLGESAATLEVQESGRSGSRLTVDLRVDNLSGHKLPTGFPSRRVWLHVRVTDSVGQLVFESGGWNPDGSIVGNDAEADPTTYEPHYFAVVSPEQVQIYEAVLQGSSGQLTTTLFDAIRYVKDNRLLAAGYQKSAPYPDLAVRGRALEDMDFDEGSDQIQYVVDVGTGTGPFTVTAELLYQSVSSVWLSGLGESAGEEVDRFLEYARAVENSPEVLATASVEVP